MEEPRAPPLKKNIREALSKAGLSKIDNGVLSQCKLNIYCFSSLHPLLMLIF
jgi:hypothetical protein